MENTAIRKALTIEEMFWQNEKERRLYELREKAILEERSAIAGARVEGKIEGKIEKAQDAICKFLKKRFGSESDELEKKVRQITDLEILDHMYDGLLDAQTLEQAQNIIIEAAKMIIR